MGSGVVFARSQSTSGGGSDGGSNDAAAAATTSHEIAFTTFITIPFTTHVPFSSRPRDADHGPLVHDSDVASTPALLPIIVMMSSNSASSGDRGRSSEGPRGDRRCPAHSLPPPAVVEVRVAWHGVGRPTANVNATLPTMPPRPGPASLLSALRRPQPGRVTQHGSRVGGPLRAAGTGSTGVDNVDDSRCRTSSGAVPAHAIQEKEVVANDLRSLAGGRGPRAAVALAAGTRRGFDAGSTACHEGHHNTEGHAHQGGEFDDRYSRRPTLRPRSHHPTPNSSAP